MATKTKTIVSKQKLVKPAVVKSVPVKTGVHRVKTSVKKTVLKSGSVKKPRVLKPKVILIDEIVAAPNAPLHLPGEISEEYVIVRRCENCAHLPMSVERLVTVFSVLIMLLAVSILFQSGQLDLNHFLVAVSPYTQAATQIFTR